MFNHRNEWQSSNQIWLGRYRGCLAGWLLLSSAVVGTAATSLVYEAESVSGPPSAWVTNQHHPNRWNLWSTDRDAAKKWSGGVVLQSPSVRSDRATVEEGAPPLHTRITGITPGFYDILLGSGRLLALSVDGRQWHKTVNGVALERYPATNGIVEFWIDDRFADPVNPGPAYYDTVTLIPRPPPPKPVHVIGWARQRPREPLGRGLTAVRSHAGIHISWRFLDTDAATATFVLERAESTSSFQRITGTPVRHSTDWLDSLAPTTGRVRYRLRAAETDLLLAETEVSIDQPRNIALSIPLTSSSATFGRCAIADLDGDGRFDFVIKTPAASIDPHEVYWKPSPGTYRLEAYLSCGRHLWTHDMGWAIEQGIWYSPFVAYDLDGDGRAEVILKAGEGDPRGRDGRVREGPEWLLVLDGLSGRERARVSWPDRSGFGEDLLGYNYASRNQIAIAYLDGRTPCVVALRGTYTVMKADAYDFDGQRLRSLWSYNSDHHTVRYRGQGAHSTRAFDLDGDDRDELILGSVVLDDTGVPLWCTRLGHPDAFYLGDLWPQRPGLEIFYVIETRQPSNGVCMVDAASGKVLWGLDRPTRHVHSIGLGADVDARWAGSEGYGADSINHKPTGERWFYSADGTLRSTNLNLHFGKHPVWWDADLQRELIVGNEVRDHEGTAHGVRWSGTAMLVADILGDWREEIVVSTPGWLHVVATDVPAFDRRHALMLNPLYRLDVAMASMGYTLAAGLPFDLESSAPNLNLTIQPDGSAARIIVTAPTNTPLSGEVRLTLPHGISAAKTNWPVAVQAGDRAIYSTELRGRSAGGQVRARLISPPAPPLETIAWLPQPK